MCANCSIAKQAIAPASAITLHSHAHKQFQAAIEYHLNEPALPGARIHCWHLGAVYAKLSVEDVGSGSKSISSSAVSIPGVIERLLKLEKQLDAIGVWVSNSCNHSCNLLKLEKQLA
jgi:hypothetical protein